MQNNPRIFNGSNISNISSVSNRYSGYIGNQMLFGWVTQVALSLGIHLAVAGGSRPTLSFLGPSLWQLDLILRFYIYIYICRTKALSSPGG